MSSQIGQSVRAPAVAGVFYPGDEKNCRGVAAEMLGAGRVVVAERVAGMKSPAVGAIVPHAGWICSGAIAAEAIAAAALRMPKPDVVVIFGAIHEPVEVDRGILDSHAIWSVPSGRSTVAAELRSQLIARGGSFAVDDFFHAREHAVEVELPFIQAAWPNAGIVPIETPPIQSAVEIGERVARIVSDAGLTAVFLASSDLTHYGPNYRFTPAGVGPQGLEWAMQNDRRLLELVTEFKPEAVISEVFSHLNACGGGAIAAMMSAARVFGASRGILLRHTSSYQTLAPVAPQAPNNAVGYAAVMVG